MAGLQGKFISKRQDWETPNDLFEPLRKEFRFTLDAAATDLNKKCRRWFSSDSLQRKWRGRVWCNPPYGDRRAPIKAWVRKGYEAARDGATVVLLLPARTNTAWFHDYCLRGDVRFVRGRPKFCGGSHGLPQPLCIVVFRPQ